MTTPPDFNTETAEYLLIFRDTDLDLRIPEPAIEEAMHRMSAWLNDCRKRGVIKGGQPLARPGRRIARPKAKQPSVVVDGPFSETKEIVGGYVVIFARDLDEAAAIADTWPMLDYGSSVEVRPLLEGCPLMARYGLSCTGAETAVEVAG